MSKIQYTVEVEHLPEGVCPEVVNEREGTRYRAMVLRGNAKIVHAMMLEPFVEAFSYELPLFVLGMTHLRLVRDGNVTPEGKQMICGKMKTLVGTARTNRDSTPSGEI